MGRLNKNYCDYFPHKANMRNHPKVKAIRTKFKRNNVSYGYAIWNMILELLTGSDGNEFEYSDDYFELLEGDFDFPSADIKLVVDYCLKMQMLFNRDGFIHSLSLDENLDPVYKKRGAAKERSEKRKRSDDGKFLKAQAEPPVVPPVVPPPPPEDPNKKFDFKKTLLQGGADPQHLTDWLNVRKKKKAVNSETAYKGFMTEVAKSGRTVAEVIKICAEKSWSGFDASWPVDKPGFQNGQQSTAIERTWKNA